MDEDDFYTTTRLENFKTHFVAQFSHICTNQLIFKKIYQQQYFQFS